MFRTSSVGARFTTGALFQLVLLTAVLLFPHGTWAADRVRMGLQVGALGSLRTALPATEQKYGLKYDIKDFSDSSATLLALDGGDIDIANTTTQHFVRAIDEGMDVVMVAGWGGGYNVLVASQGLPIQKDGWDAFKVLAKERARAKKPLRIAVPTGSMQHLKLIYRLKEQGLNPDSDVDLINIPFPNHPRALESGEADLAMTLAVFGAISIHNKSGKIFSHMFGNASGKQEIAFIVRGKDVRERPDYVDRVVRSYAEAMNVLVGHPDKQVELERTSSRLPMPVLEMQQKEFLRIDERINVADIKKVAEQMFEQGWIRKRRGDDVDKYINLAFLERATGKSKAQLSSW